MEKSQETQRRSRRDEDLTKEVTSTTKRILVAQKGRKVCRKVVMTDSCIPPWKPPSLVKDLQTLFGSVPPESTEKETRRGLHGRERSRSR